MQGFGKIISAILIPRPMERFLIACSFSTVALLAGMIGLDLLDGTRGLRVSERPAIWLMGCCAPHWILACAVVHSYWNTAERLIGLAVLCLNIWLVSLHLDWMASDFGQDKIIERLCWLTILSTAIVLAGGLIAEQLKILMNRMFISRRLSRTHGLVIFAVAFFVTVKLWAYFGQEFAPYWNQGMYWYWIPFLLIVTGIMFPWNLAMLAKTPQGQICLFLVGWVFAGVAVSYLFQASESVYEMIVYLLFGLECAMAMILLVKSELPEGRATPRWVSVCSGIRASSILVLALIGIFWATLFDIRTTFQGPGFKLTWWDQYQLRKLQMWPEVRMSSPLRGSSVSVRVNPATDRDLLSKIVPLIPPRGYLQLENLTPEFETRSLVGLKPWLGFGNCELNPNQLFEAMDGCRQVRFWNCKFLEDPTANFEPRTITSGFVYLNSNSEGSLGAFVSAVRNFENISSLRVQLEGELLPDEAQALCEIGQQTNLEIQANWLPRIWECLETQESRERASRHMVLDIVDRKLTKEELRVMAQFPIEVRIMVDFEDLSTWDSGAQLWNLIFASRRAQIYSDVWDRRFRREIHSPNVARQVRSEFGSKNWIVTQSGDGTPTSLWLPDTCFTFAIPMSEAPSLKTLSFDSDWLGFQCLANPNDSTPLQSVELSRFTGLERLDLGQTKDSGDFKFLAALPNLNHLSITLLDSLQCSTLAKDLPTCTQLERLVLSGSPNLALIQAIKSMPNLKEIVLIEANAGDRTAEAEALSTALNGPIVRRLIRDELNSILPPEFLEHREQVRQRLMKQ